MFSEQLTLKRPVSRPGLMTRLLLLLAVMLFVAVGCKTEEKKEDKAEKAEKAEGTEKKDDPSAQTADKGEQPAGESGDSPAPTEARGDSPAPTEAGGDSPAPTEAGDSPAGTDTQPVLALPAESAGGPNPFLDRVPADTLYLWASISTLRMDQVPFNVADFVPMYEAAAKQMQQDPDQQALGEMLLELTSVLKTEGIEGFGVKDGAHYALYGVGVWPVLNFELSDGKKFESLLTRIFDKTGVTAKASEFGGKPYLLIQVDDVSIAVAIAQTEATVTLATTESLDWVLGYAIGDKKPEAATVTASARLAPLAARAPAGAAGVSAGFLDVLALQKTLSGEAQNLAAESLKAAGAPLPLIEGNCKDEFAMLAGAAPQLVYTGYYSNEGNIVANLTLDIVDEAFRGELSKVKGSAPGLGRGLPTGSFGFVGLGVKLKDAVAFLTSQASRIQAKPFQCQELTFFNELAEDLQGVEGRVPPFLMEVTGAYVQVDSLKIDMDAGVPRDINALVTIGTTQPRELWMAAGAISPELAKVELGKEATRLPAIPGAEFLGDLFALSSDNAIGLALNQAMVPHVTQLLNSPAGGPSPLVVIGYDQARLAQLLPADVIEEGGMSELFDALGGFGMTSYGISIVDQGLQIHIVQNLSAKKAP